jgi:hypothetical protein
VVEKGVQLSICSIPYYEGVVDISKPDLGWKKSFLLNDIQQRFEEIKELTWEEDHLPIFEKIDRSCLRVKEELCRSHERKLLKFERRQQPETTSKGTKRTALICLLEISPDLKNEF